MDATRLDELVAFYRDTLLGAPSRRLLVSAPSPAHGGPRGEELASESRSPTRITDDAAFKTSKSVFEIE